MDLLRTQARVVWCRCLFEILSRHEAPFIFPLMRCNAPVSFSEKHDTPTSMLHCGYGVLGIICATEMIVLLQKVLRLTQKMSQEKDWDLALFFSIVSFNFTAFGPLMFKLCYRFSHILSLQIHGWLHDHSENYDHRSGISVLETDRCQTVPGRVITVHGATVQSHIWLLLPLPPVLCGWEHCSGETADQLEAFPFFLLLWTMI